MRLVISDFLITYTFYFSIVAKDLGADEVIDKSKENLWIRAKVISPQGYHIIFDANGVSTLRERYTPHIFFHNSAIMFISKYVKATII